MVSQISQIKFIKDVDRDVLRVSTTPFDVADGVEFIEKIIDLGFRERVPVVAPCRVFARGLGRENEGWGSVLCCAVFPNAPTLSSLSPWRIS